MGYAQDWRDPSNVGLSSKLKERILRQNKITKLLDHKLFNAEGVFKHSSIMFQCA